MRTERNNESSMGYGSLAIIIGVGLTLWGVGGMKELEHEKRFDPNFVDPKKATMNFEDLDKDGRKESILKYGGRSYLMKYDPNSNTASLIPYEVEINIQERR